MSNNGEIQSETVTLEAASGSAVFSDAGTDRQGRLWVVWQSFRKAPSEKAWEEYNTRKTPMPGHEFSWGVAPSISRRGAGLSFGGTF